MGKAAARYTKGANKAEKDEDANIKDCKAQSQHTTEAWNSAMDANTDMYNAYGAYNAADVYGADASADAWRAANAYGAEYTDAWAADRDAWAGMNAGFAAATPQYMGYGASPFMW